MRSPKRHIGNAHLTVFKYPDGDVLAVQTARGNVAFEVPGNIGAMNFVYEPAIIGDIVQVKLQ